MDLHGEDCIAAVLAGAGARGAYEAGLLATLLPVLEANGRRPRLFVGTSAGAINAVLFASLAHLPADEAATRALALWRQVSRRNVVTSIVRSSVRALARYLGQLGGAPVELTSLLDPSPLQHTLSRLIDWPQLHRNIQHPSLLQGVSVTATHCATGRTRVLVECNGQRALPPVDDSRAIDYIAATLDPCHLMASAAIPLLFPPVWVDTPARVRGWYLDGGVRLNAPIKPAVALGATRLVLVASTPLDQVPACEMRAGPQPDLRAALADVLRALLTDRMVEDIRRLGQMNEILLGQAAGSAPPRAPSGRERRLIPFVFAGPASAETLSVLTAQTYVRRYGGGRWLCHALDYPVLHRLLGGAGGVNGELLSYFFFEQEFLEAAIAQGQRDARQLLDETRHELHWETRMADTPTLALQCEPPLPGTAA